jgi:uncharacterized protein YdhG (YjbR/CyaY superfamily)
LESFYLPHQAAGTIDEYITQFSLEIREILKKIRKTIHEAAPDTSEAISYRMPTFSLKGRPVVYFAAFKNHIGFYSSEYHCSDSFVA